MEKSIEQLIQLSQNPHYQMTDADYKRLQAYLQNKNKDEIKNTNYVLKNNPSVQKHDTN